MLQTVITLCLTLLCACVPGSVPKGLGCNVSSFTTGLVATNLSTWYSRYCPCRPSAPCFLFFCQCNVSPHSAKEHERATPRAIRAASTRGSLTRRHGDTVNRLCSRIRSEGLGSSVCCSTSGLVVTNLSTWSSCYCPRRLSAPCFLFLSMQSLTAV